MKLIKQFERESGLDVYSLGLDKAKWESRLEAYTLLIVRECSSKVDWVLAEGGKTQGDLIKQHFGVEE